jgi:hypothetical protein
MFNLVPNETLIDVGVRFNTFESGLLEGVLNFVWFGTMALGIFSADCTLVCPYILVGSVWEGLISHALLLMKFLKHYYNN